MATNYERGRQFEYRVRDKLKSMGALEVIRAAGSHTVVDIVALFPFGVTRLVQCKRDRRLSKSERERILSLASGAHVTAWLAYQGARGEGVMLERLK